MSSTNKVHNLVMHLMRERRMFLAENHNLDRDIFAEAIQLDKQIRDIYETQQAATTQAIQLQEAALGIAPPVLEKNQVVVKCSRFTGGLDILSVRSVAPLLAFIPQRREKLFEELFGLLHGPRDEIKPKELPKREAYASELTVRMWNQLRVIPNTSSILILKTRFYATREEGLPAIRKRLGDLMILPLGLAYLLYKNELVEPILEHETLITLGGNDHTQITHWRKKEPYFLLERTAGYDYQVMAAFLI